MARITLIFITTLAMLLTNTNATSRLEREFIHPVVEPSQPPDPSLLSPHSSPETNGNEVAPYPGIKRMPWHHTSNKSEAGADVIIGGYVMACVVVVLLYIQVTKRTSERS